MAARILLRLHHRPTISRQLWQQRILPVLCFDVRTCYEEKKMNEKWITVVLFCILLTTPCHGRRRDGRQLQTSLAFLAKLMPFFLSTVTGEEISERNDLEETEAFSYQNLLSMGIKLILALLSNPDQALEKADSFPTQAVLGTVISAMTGSTNPKEVAKMAKQATEVINVISTLFETLQTSLI